MQSPALYAAVLRDNEEEEEESIGLHLMMMSEKWVNTDKVVVFFVCLPQGKAMGEVQVLHQNDQNISSEDTGSWGEANFG